MYNIHSILKSKRLLEHLFQIPLFSLIFLIGTNNLFAENLKEVNKNPYHFSWGQESLIFGTGIVVGYASGEIYESNDSVSLVELVKLDKMNINFFDRFAADNGDKNISKISDYLLLSQLAAPALLFFDDNIGKDWENLSIMYCENILFAATLPSYGKGLAKRLRPYTYNDKLSFEDKMAPDTRASFFSGHTCLAFSSAVFISQVYSDYYPNSEWKPYIWGLSLASASTVAYLRIAAGAHFPTDVIVGAAVGSAVGYLIPYLHRNTISKDNSEPLGADQLDLELLNTEKSKFTYKINPIFGENLLGASFSLHF
jgi:membrane-associated phospholipid phosphatase